MITTMLRNTRKPDISFYRSGRIDITAHAAKMLQLKAGDVIDIAKTSGEYYLYRKYKSENVVGRHEAQCQKTSNKGKVCNNLRVYSKRLCQEVLRINGNAKAVRLPVGQLVRLTELDADALVIIIRHNLATS